MALKTSTGIRNYMLDTGPVRDALNLGFINIYDGTPPANADQAIGSAGTNNLLCIISNDATATGITLEAAAASGSIPKESTEIWRGTNSDTGVASFYRHVAPGDTGALSTTEARLQGSIALAGAEMNLSDTTLTISGDQKVDYYLINLPTA